MHEQQRDGGRRDAGHARRLADRRGTHFFELLADLVREARHARIVEILGQSFPAAWIASGIASGAAVLLVYLYLYRTRQGYLMRAVMVARDARRGNVRKLTAPVSR